MFKPNGLLVIQYFFPLFITEWHIILTYLIMKIETEYFLLL